MLRKIGVFLLGIIGLASVALNIYFLKIRSSSLSSNNITLQRFNVTSVIDGDTFKISDGRRVRLMGINTPELGKCLGDEAKEKLITLVSGKDVVLKDQFSDPYGRIMANVFVGESYINKEMISSGLARMDYYENPHRDELKIAYAQAKEKKLGIFSGICVSVNPPASCIIKGNVDDNTQKKYYYLSACKNYAQVVIDLSTADQWFCTEEEAKKAGFRKSLDCPK